MNGDKRKSIADIIDSMKYIESRAKQKDPVSAPDSPDGLRDKIRNRVGPEVLQEIKAIEEEIPRINNPKGDEILEELHFRQKMPEKAQGVVSVQQKLVKELAEQKKQVETAYESQHKSFGEAKARISKGTFKTPVSKEGKPARRKYVFTAG